MQKRQIALIIFDGWGMREDTEYNAIAQANTPYFDYLWRTYPHSLLQAGGEAVGLPEGKMGNSEVGHMTIGAGKVLDTEVVRITKAIRNDEFSKNPILRQLLEHVKNNDSTLHIQGLLSPAGIHSHQDHLYEILRVAKKNGLQKVAIHAFTDGRDTAPQIAHQHLKELEDVLAEVGIGRIATASGRYYAMDRDNNWDRIAKAEEALFECKGNVCVNRQPSEVMAELHAEGKLDEYIDPIVFLDENNNGYKIQPNDGVLFYNFRTDRGRQLSKRILERTAGQNVCYVTMTQYDKNLKSLVMFPPLEITTTLAAELSKAGLTQTHIAETDKYAHVTFFLNGGREEPYTGEHRIMIESRKDVPTHDLAPEMKAKEIADAAIKEIDKGTDFVVLNFANPDIVGHTANVPALLTALEVVDSQLKRIVEAVMARDGVAVITADHGNAELNIDPETGNKHTAHTNNPVPFIVTDPALKVQVGSLADVAPTILVLYGMAQPPAMTGKNLIV